MTIVISCVNLKGGVGKTAISVNFAAYCGKNNLKTLLIDLDPQTNATFSCLKVDEWRKHSKTHGTVADVLGLRSHTNAEGNKKDPKDVIKKNVFPGVDLLPSHLDLFTIDLDLAGAPARERRLQKALKPLQDAYDIIVCDCPPNLTIPTQNALAMSSHYVVPISPDFLSSLGVAILLTRIKKLGDELDNEPEHAGIILSRVGRPAQHRQLTASSLRKKFGDLVLKNELRERVAISEATEKQKPIYDWTDPAAAREFKAMSKELLDRLGVAL